jgi:hypothetical protein
MGGLFWALASDAVRRKAARRIFMAVTLFESIRVEASVFL